MINWRDNGAGRWWRSAATARSTPCRGRGSWRITPKIHRRLPTPRRGGYGAGPYARWSTAPRGRTRERAARPVWTLDTWARPVRLLRRGRALYSGRGTWRRAPHPRAPDDCRPGGAGENLIFALRAAAT